MVSIESDSLFVLRIDNEHEGGKIGPDGFGGGICQHRRAKAAALKSPIDGQPANANGRNRGIAWQTPGLFRRKIVEREACRRQGVVSCNPAAGLDGHKAVGNVPADILRCLRPKIPIENVVAAVK